VCKLAASFKGEEAFPSVARIDEVLSPHAGVRFRAQPVVPKRQRRRVEVVPYDAAIVLDGVVPTREGSWHDFMNALVWATYPRAKRALHERQHRYVTLERSMGRAGKRLPCHDALAVLDEGGVLVSSALPLEDDAALEDALARREAIAFVFGHAIFEAIAIRGPWPLVRARPLALAQGLRDDSLVRAADEALAALLADDSAFESPRALPRISLARIREMDA